MRKSAAKPVAFHTLKCQRPLRCAVCAPQKPLRLGRTLISPVRRFPMASILSTARTVPGPGGSLTRSPSAVTARRCRHDPRIARTREVNPQRKIQWYLRDSCAGRCAKHQDGGNGTEDVMTFAALDIFDCVVPKVELRPWTVAVGIGIEWRLVKSAPHYLLV
jgi:hypothetical protein